MPVAAWCNRVEIHGKIQAANRTDLELYDVQAMEFAAQLRLCSIHPVYEYVHGYLRHTHYFEELHQSCTRAIACGLTSKGDMQMSK